MRNFPKPFAEEAKLLLSDDNSARIILSGRSALKIGKIITISE